MPGDLLAENMKDPYKSPVEVAMARKTGPRIHAGIHEESELQV